MSRLFVILLVAGMGWLGAAPRVLAGEAAPANAPKIEFPETEFDFGTVFKGEPAEHVFKVLNKGTAPLVIKNVRTSCGCTAAVLNEQNIAPGGAGEIKVTYDTRKGSGPTSKDITVISNDPAKEESTLKIRLILQVEVEVLPGTAQFGAIFADKEENNRTVRVSSPTMADLLVKKVTIDSPHVDSTIADATDGSNGKVITFRVRNTAPFGEFTATATVETNSAKQPVIDIPITATVYGDIEVNPTKMHLEPHFPGETKENRVSVRDRRQTGDFIVQSVIDKSGYLNLRIETVKENKEYAIVATPRAEMPGNLKQGSYSGTMEIITNRPGEEKLIVNYSGFIKAPDNRIAEMEEEDARGANADDSGK